MCIVKQERAVEYVLVHVYCVGRQAVLVCAGSNHSTMKSLQGVQADWVGSFCETLACVQLGLKCCYYYI